MEDSKLAKKDQHITLPSTGIYIYLYTTCNNNDIHANVCLLHKIQCYGKLQHSPAKITS